MRLKTRRNNGCGFQVEKEEKLTVSTLPVKQKMRVSPETLEVGLEGEQSQVGTAA